MGLLHFTLLYFPLPHFQRIPIKRTDSPASSSGAGDAGRNVSHVDAVGVEDGGEVVLGDVGRDDLLTRLETVLTAVRTVVFQSVTHVLRRAHTVKLEFHGTDTDTDTDFKDAPIV